MGQIKIDGPKLEAIFERKGLQKAAVSRLIGFSDNYWSKACKRGECSLVAMNAIEAIYHISPDEYREMDKKPEPPQQMDMLNDRNIKVDADELTQIIREGVRLAMLEVFKLIGEAKKKEGGTV